MNTNLSPKDLCVTFKCKELDKMPSKIIDTFKSVCGDGFHGMDCMKVPVHHSLKKSFCMALMEAWFTWDQDTFKKVVEKLKENGCDKEMIEKVCIFNTKLFIGCCPRKVPPPSILHYRVWAVFAFCGNQVCPNTKKPLFNKHAWKKANNLLKEIIKGCYSDDPSFNYCRYLSNIARGKSNKIVLACHF